MSNNTIYEKENTMYYIELRYTNGEIVRLPEPYLLWQDAKQALNHYIRPEYTAYIAQD